MKKFMRFTAIALVVVLLAGVLASCGQMLIGVYSNEASVGSLVGSKVSYNFKGTKVTLTVTTTLLGETESESYDGSYEIKKADDGTQTIVLEFEDDDASLYAGSKSFSQDKDAGTITIGGVTLTKK